MASAELSRRVEVAECQWDRHEVRLECARQRGRGACLRSAARAVSARSGGARRTGRLASCPSAWAPRSRWASRTPGRCAPPRLACSKSYPIRPRQSRIFRNRASSGLGVRAFASPGGGL